MPASAKERLLESGLELLLLRGYSNLGIQALLDHAGVPKGSFYHHFKSKEDFAMQTIDRYMAEVHQGLDECLGDASVPHLKRARGFFEATEEKYRSEGYLGCLLGGLGQELSGVSPAFATRIEECLAYIAGRLAECFDQAKVSGELGEEVDSQALGDLLVNCWEGAALRTRLGRDPSPLSSMLDFYFAAVSGE